VRVSFPELVPYQPFIK